MRKPGIGVGVGVVGVVVLGAAIGAAVLRKSNAGDGTKPEPPPLVFSTAEVMPAQAAEIVATVTFSGPLQAPQTATVRSRVAASLRQLDVAEGTRVRAGQRLGTLDTAELEARRLERQAQLEAARVTLAQAERAHQSNQRLAEQQFLSPLALEGSKATLDGARAQVQVAGAQLETLNVALREAALVSPIAGIVARRHAVAGEKLAAEQQVVTVVDLRTLEMAGAVGTHEVTVLQPGMPVSLLVEGEAAPRTARIARIAPAAEPGTRAIGVTVSLDNPDERLRAGQFASAQVRLPGRPAAVTVPLTALTVASGQEHVWTLEQGKLVRRAITTGRRDAASGRVEVLNGLPVDALVLGARFENLREGAAAQVRATPPAGGASGPQPIAPASSPMGAR